MNLMKTSCAALALSLVAGASQAAIVSVTSPDSFGAVADNSSETISVTVTDDLTISDLDLALSLSSTWVGDLILTLLSPEGTEVDVLFRIGTPATFFGDSSDLNGVYTFDDEAATTMTDAAFAVNDGTVAPGSYSGADSAAAGGGLLSAFDGESSAGVWSLTLSDNAVGDDTSGGAFTLTIEGEDNTAPVPLPAGLPLMIAGLGGLAFLRRARKAA